MRWWRWAGVAALTSAIVGIACGQGTGSGSVGYGGDAGYKPPDDGGSPDAGPADGGSDGGTTDGGTADGGSTDGGTDGGATDGGVSWTPPPPIDFPSVADWTFYGPQHGGPHDVYGAATDQSGNLWVAGGEDGLFLLRAGASTFERLTMDHGLRPYGYLEDGSDPVGPKFLKVISVAGGPANTVFVGYEGQPGCEGAGDNLNNRPKLAYIYKSGDADKVTLDASGKISVVHYDIFSGPGIVAAEMEGREKLCTIHRLAYDARSNSVWFGGNHGFARGDATFAGNPKCNGENGCAGVTEHAHPAFNGCIDEKCSSWAWMTDGYYGVAVDPQTDDVWFGGTNRTTKFHWGATSGSSWGRFYTAESWTEDHSGSCAAAPCFTANRIDIWPDAVTEPQVPLPSQRDDDNVSAIAGMNDGTAWVGSWNHGLAHLASDGSVISRQSFPKDVGGLAADPKDQSIWMGDGWGGLGVLRQSPTGTMTKFDASTFGPRLVNAPVRDVQVDRSGAQRRIMVAFRMTASNAGFVAIYSGE